MVSMHGIMFAVGYGFSSWIGFAVYFVSVDGSKSTFPWRFPLAFQAVPALIMLAGSPWLPYSPRWLMMKQRYEEAEAVLKCLHARKEDEHHETAIKEFYQMKRQLEHDRQLKATISPFEIFKTPSNRKRALIVAVMMWFNMFTGVLIVRTLSPSGNVDTLLIRESRLRTTPSFSSRSWVFPDTCLYCCSLCG